MNSVQFRVRRATLDDIGPLMQVWSVMRLAPEELAKRVTEFQVAEDADGRVIGGIGLQITEKQGRIHSEGFLDFAQSEALRSMLWDRLQSVATNHGLLRLWTQEDAPFWSRCGLTPPDQEALEKLPLAWRSFPGKWLTLKLRDDLDSVLSADAEFALFMHSEKERTRRAFQQARVLKAVALALAFGLLILVIGGAFYLIRNNPSLLGR